MSATFTGKIIGVSPNKKLHVIDLDTIETANATGWITSYAVASVGYNFDASTKRTLINMLSKLHPDISLSYMSKSEYNKQYNVKSEVVSEAKEIGNINKKAIEVVDTSELF